MWLPPAGSLDRTVRLWDLQSGLPAATSRHLAGTVRCLALDERLLVAAGASQNCALRAWRAADSAGGGGDGEEGEAPGCRGSLFDLGSGMKLQHGHTGPVWRRVVAFPGRVAATPWPDSRQKKNSPRAAVSCGA